jgi:hypothetical protein
MKIWSVWSLGVAFILLAIIMLTPSTAITVAGTSGLSPLVTSWQTAYHYVRYSNVSHLASPPELVSSITNQIISRFSFYFLYFLDHVHIFVTNCHPFFPFFRLISAQPRTPN